MPEWLRASALLLVFTLLLTACAPTPQARSGESDSQTRRAGPKRIVAAIQGDPHTVYQQLNPASRVRGIDAIETLVAAGLTAPDGERGALFAQLAEEVPSIENGLWKLFPDGRMETTWRIRPGAQWHDGTPFTSDDLVFTGMVVQDPELPIFGNNAYDLIEEIAAPDSRTIIVRWKQPFIEADTLFSYTRAVPFPRHLLETAYLESKATFTDHVYWSTEYVGTGPFKLRDWFPGSHLVVEAYDRYVLGRPKIDLVEIRFIPDANTLAANLMSGVVELTLGRSISGEQALQVRDQWRDGRLELAYENWIALYPQFINANPPVVTDVRFRRALLHATDRQQMVDVLMGGLSAVAHSWLRPGQPEYREIEERMVVRYEYDPRRAAQMIEGIGYTKAPDGFYRDSAGQRLSVEARTTVGDDLREKMLLTIVDEWQRVGVATEPVLVPRQLAADLEYRATFPAFELVRQPNDVRGTRSLHSRYTPLPENNFRVTGNRTRYQNPELDALTDRYFMTIPIRERMEVMGQIVHHLSDRVVIMGMVYNASVTLVSNRLLNVGPGREGATQGWNAHLWDVRS